MSLRSWHLGRIGLAASCALIGALTAIGFVFSAGVSTAQEGTASSKTPRIDQRWLALILAERSGLDGPAALAGATAGALTLNVQMQDGAVAGFVPSGAAVTVALARGGSVLSAGTANPILTEAGWFYSWTFLFLGEYSIMGFRPGDVITVSQGGQTLSLTAAAFRAGANASTDHVAGEAAPDAGLTLHGIPALDSSQVFTATTTANAQGVFDFDLTATFDLSAGDYGYVRHALDGNRSETTRFVAPQLQVQVGGDTVGGYVEPYQALSVRVLSGAMVVASAAGTGGADGAFTLCVAECSLGLATQAVVRPGQQVELTTGAQTLTLTVPSLTARSDRTQGQVTGVAAPGALVRIYRWPGPAEYTGGILGIVQDAGVTVTASTTGTYTAAVPLQNADFGAAVVRDANGHLAYARYAVPELHIVLGDGSPASLVWGQIDRIATPVTVTVIGPSDLPKAEIRSSTTATGRLLITASWPYVSQGGLLLAGGDVISITDAGGLVTAIPVQPITVNADVFTQRISGRGPASATLPIHLDTSDSYPAWPSGYDTVAFSDLAGLFGIDLVEYRLKTSTKGTISWTNPEGHILTQSFAAGQTCLPDVGEVVVNGNTVSYGSSMGDWSTCGSELTTSLRSGSGGLKHTLVTYAYGFYGPMELVDAQGGPIRIEPGDILSVVNGTREMTMSVPLLSVTADVLTQRISGLAPAGSTVRLARESALRDMTYVGPIPTWEATVVADSNGEFQVNTQILPGDRIEASVRNRLGTSFTAVAVVPAIELQLFDSTLLAALPPLTPFTVTVQTTRPVTPTAFAHRTDDRGRIHGSSPYGPARLPWVVEAGDRVIVQAGAYQRDWLIPSLTAEVDNVSSMVRGEAPANHLLTLFWDGGGSDAYTVDVRSDGAGRYATSWPPSVAPQTGLKVTLHTAQGDRLALLSGSISWHIRLHSPCLELRTPRRFSAGTLTLTDMQGHVRATQSIAGYDQTFWRLCLSHDANAVLPRPGDRYELVTPVGSWAYSVPDLSVVHDARRAVVTGTTPPGGFATITLPAQSVGDPALTQGRTVTVDPLGRFGMDVSDLTWRPGQQGLLRYTDLGGNTVERTFALVGIQHWLPWIGHP